MANLINEAEIRATWSPIIESATGINDSNKLAWMSEYCHNHKLYEEANLSSIQPIMLKGMGATAFPTAGNADGSGDKAPTLLPLAMQVAAQTIGLDLVPVVPMAGPMGLLSYLDFVYDGGAARVAGANYPANTAANVYYIKTDDGTGADIAAAAGHAGYEYLGESRIDGKDIYVTTGDLVAATLLADFQAAVGNSAAEMELVKALEDHIPGFAGADADGNPFSREAGEKTPEKIMGLSLFSKSVSAETFQVAAAVTREQVQDLKQFGVDAVAQVEAVLTNELTQSINNYILAEMRRLAGLNNHNVSLDLDLSAGTGSFYGGDTRGDAHRRILSGILAAANLIANRGRRGAGNFAVVGAKMATALQSVAGFVPNPMANTFNQVAGAIYPVGSVAGVNIYTDPRLAFEDKRVLVGRKGDGNSPGLVFMPYLMAESVQTIAEGTMAPKIAVKSRFALVEAGFHPETMYVEFNVDGVSL